MFNITATSRTITEYTLTITDEQVTEVLVDPGPLQAQLRRMRAEQSAVQSDRKHGAKKIRLGRPKNGANGNGTTSPKDSSAKRVMKKRGVNVLIECPHCQKLVKGGQGLATHLRKAHPGIARAAQSS